MPEREAIDKRLAEIQASWPPEIERARRQVKYQRARTLECERVYRFGEE